MEVEDFFPKYPNIYKNESNPTYMNPYNDISFEQAMYNKKEFSDLRVKKDDEKEFEDEFRDFWINGIRMNTIITNVVLKLDIWE